MDKFNPRDNKIQMLYEGMTVDNEIENIIRNTLSGTARKTTAKLMWPSIKKAIKGATQSKFNKVWKSLVDDGYLTKTEGDSYKWEI